MTAINEPRMVVDINYIRPIICFAVSTII